MLENNPNPASHGEADRFYAHFANGLHAMAQPLTVLRTAIAAAVMPGMPEEDRRKYTAISAEQVESACLLFQNLQDLVATAQQPARCEPVDLTELLHIVHQAQKPLLHKAGLELVVNAPHGLPEVPADKDRTIQALFDLLKVAASLSSAGDSIVIGAEAGERGVTITIGNPEARGKALRSATRLVLALVEASILSQHGTYRLHGEPWQVSFTFPLLERQRSKPPVRAAGIPRRERLRIA